MRPRRSGIVAIVAGTLAAGAWIGSPASADVVVEQVFFADSGDSCAATKGVFAWYQTPRVDATGTLFDKACDERFSAAFFTAYTGRKPVDSEIVRADDDAVEFVFSLENTTSTAPLERVTVQVCRFVPVVPGPPERCGPLREFRSPFIIGPAAAPAR